MLSIFSQENQYQVINSHHIHMQSMQAYCRRYVAGEDVLQLAADVDFPPCLLMRRMLEHMLPIARSKTSDMMKNPELVRRCDPNLTCEIDGPGHFEASCEETYQNLLESLLRANFYPIGLLVQLPACCVAWLLSNVLCRNATFLEP